MGDEEPFDVDEYIDERLEKLVHPEEGRGVSDRCPNCASGWHGKPLYVGACRGSHLSSEEAHPGEQD